MKKNISITLTDENFVKAIKNLSQTLDGKIVLSLEVESLSVYGEDWKPEQPITPDDYYRWGEIIKRYGVNLKDLREVIMLASVWWTYGPWENEEVFIQNYLLHKSEFRENVYTGELISAILNTLGKVTDPVAYFYSRLRSYHPRNFVSALDYVAALYPLNNETQK